MDFNKHEYVDVYSCILLRTKLCLPQIPVEALTLNVTVFGDRTIREVITVKQGLDDR